MAAETVCPRCGFKNSFMEDVFHGTCVCRVCRSQLDWREIPGAGEDCLPSEDDGAPEAGCPVCEEKLGQEDG